LQGRFSEQAAKDMSSDYPGSRVYIWTRSLDIVKSHPVFGVGQGNFYDEYVARLPVDITDNRKLTHAHNDFINVAAIAGIPGALFFIGIWLAVFHFLWHGSRKRHWSSADRAFCLAAFLAGVAFLITSMVEATFADEEVRQMLMFVWAIGLASWYKSSEQSIQTA
jgi:O-antigen ligase